MGNTIIDLLEFVGVIFFYSVFWLFLILFWLFAKIIYIIPIVIISMVMCYIIGSFELFTILLISLLVFWLYKIRFKKD